MQTIVVTLEDGRVALCEVKVVLTMQEAQELGAALHRLRPSSEKEEPSKGN